MNIKSATALTATLLATLSLAVAQEPAAEEGAVTTSGVREYVNTNVTTTRISIVQSTIPGRVVGEPRVYRTLVLDFQSADTIGDRRFLDAQGKPITIPERCTLTGEDRQTMHPWMQGVVRAIDAVNTRNTDDAERARQMDSNDYDIARGIALQQSAPRPMLLGAEYLSAMLGGDGGSIRVVPTADVHAAIAKLSRQQNTVVGALQDFAQCCGVDMVVSGTISDIRSKGRKFSGYGITTEMTIYELDVMVNAYEAATGASLFTGMATGTATVRKLPAQSTFDDNLYDTAMKDALGKVAQRLRDAISKRAKEEAAKAPKDFAVWVSALEGAQQRKVSVSIDGQPLPQLPAQLRLAPGAHQLRITCDDLAPAQWDFQLSGDTKFQLALTSSTTSTNTSNATDTPAPTE